MYKFISILYLVIFSLYVWFSRQPDYFDGEFAPATIVLVKDSALQKQVSKASFTVGKMAYQVDADYLFRSYQTGERVQVIYELSNPKKAAVYAFWGYWLTLGELLATIVMWFVLFQVAVGITKNPTQEALLEQQEYVPEKNTKYDMF
ncbi:MAG: hypothetical protein QM541_09000 [Flavobacterium sp.]|nr:hypothetical protein [Flavobacterium sp.]